MAIVTTVFNVLGQPSDSLDTQATRDKQMLQRSYFQFLQTIAIHDVTEVIATQGEWCIKQRVYLYGEGGKIILSCSDNLSDFLDTQGPKAMWDTIRDAIEKLLSVSADHRY